MGGRRMLAAMILALVSLVHSNGWAAPSVAAPTKPHNAFATGDRT